MSIVTQLGYIGFTVSDLRGWEDFGSQLLGLEVVHRRADGGFSLRMDERAQRFVIEPGSADDLTLVGWEVADAKALLVLAERLRQAGFPVTEAPPELLAARQVDGLVTTLDPNGLTIEIYYGQRVAVTPFRSPLLVSSYLAGDKGFGHFLLAVKDKRASLDFYQGLLGLKISDHITQELAPGLVADATFFHCNGRHHSLAICELPSPKLIHHFMIEVTSMDDVGRIHDRCGELQTPLAMSLGKHPNDKMFSFYVQTPSGFALEYGWGGVVIDDASWEVRHYDRLSEWGHRPVAAPL